MPFHEVDKKANSKYFSDKQIGSFKDAGKSNGESSVSCEINTNVDNNRKLSTKDIPTQPQNGNKLGAVHQEQSILKTENQFPQPIGSSVSFLVERAIKMHNTIKKQTQNPLHSAAAIRENTDNKTAGTSCCPNVESIAPVGKKSKLDRFDAKAAVRNITGNSNSLIRAGTENKLTPRQLAEETLSSTPTLTFKFSNISSTPCEGHSNYDYLKEIDSSVRESPFNQFEKLIQTTKTAEGVLSFAPEISPPKQIILNNSRTCRGVLSVKDSTPSLFRESDANNTSYETNAEFEYEDNDGRYSSEEYPKSSYANDDSAFVGGGNASCPPTPANQSMLLINQPIRVKCIDEATKHTREIIIYSDEFLTNRLQETGSRTTEKEVFKDLLSHCVVYKGKTLRMITDAEKFIHNLRDNSKSQGDTNWNSIKVTKQIPQLASGSDIQKKDVRKAAKSLNEESPNKGEKLFVQKVFKKKKIGNLMKAFKSSNPKKRQITGVYPSFPVVCKQPKDSCVKRNDEKIDTTKSVKKLTSTLQKINVEEIALSAFKHHFNFYATFKSRLKSGFAISKNNSNFWLKTCGIISDESDEKIANECFHAAAGMKCILNIKDYLQYLTKLARELRLTPLNVIHQLMSTDTHSLGRSTVN